ncbi:hypothetical protein [Sphingobacterium spiritivorum]|uniref:hypothetical protein n=1 Tax=Sphingobacterium spiritivorum TaxID=258 RepID=UPI00191B13F8|nr:hypothetical protein [Sphingobacterium spiritivorum]QQS95891.1 hypothetical protein I6J03_21370 [Sphingobacterium spiritivorum]
MMNKKNKTDYISPAIISNTIELEQGIAASSARLVPGGTGTNSANPQVEDWTTDTESRDLTF